MTRAIEQLGAILLVGALLLPVGDAPWHSFWREWAASIGVALLVLCALSTVRDLGLELRIRGQLVAIGAFGLAVLCWLQFAFGLLTYRSDALIPSIYLLAFGGCVVVAASLPLARRELLADRLAAAFMIAAFLSAPLAVLQWLGWLHLDLGMRVAGGRPVAHMEQANLLCSLQIQGAIGAWRLAARGRLSIAVAATILVPVLLTAVLTQSRVAWLVAGALLCVAVLRRDLIAWRTRGIALVTVALLVVALELLLPRLNEYVGITGPTLEERMSEGRRPAAWSLFVHAALARPWIGWGALQNGAAQFAVADQHASLGYFFSSAHNLVIDLIVWFGIPVGLLAGVLLFSMVKRIGCVTNLAALTSTIAAVALLLHALVEFPLHYAYFLFPLGLLIGITAPNAPPTKLARRHNALKYALIPSAALTATIVLALMGHEYRRLADVRPILAIDKITSHLWLEAYGTAPDVILLDQLQASHTFAAMPLGPEMDASNLDAARVAMARTPFSPTIERYALLAGLNNRSTDAQEALSRVCKFESQTQCAATADAWLLRRRQWPQLPRWPGPTPSIESQQQ